MISWCNDLAIGLLAYKRGGYLVLLNTSDKDITHSCEGVIVMK